MSARPLALLLFGVALLAQSTPAEARRKARTTATWDQWSGSAGLRASGSSTLGIGVGLHVGKTLAEGFYVGGLLDYASSTDAFGPGSNEWSATTILGEGGYDWALSERLIARPVALLGWHSVDLEVCIDGVCNAGGESGPTFGGGGHLIYLFDGFHIGGEARATLGAQATLAIGGNVGLIF